MESEHMNIGGLSERIKLYEHVVTEEDAGFGATYDWVERAEAWAQVRRPRIQTGNMIGSADALMLTQGFTLRSRKDISKGWRVEYKGEMYEVLHIDRSVPGEITLTTRSAEAIP